MFKTQLFLMKLLVILNLAFLIQCHPSQAATSEKRVALIIGNSAYQNTPPLANPKNDANEMGKVLKRIGFDVDVVVDATKPQMDQALRRFGNKLDGSGAAVFFYAGHGIQVDGVNYILPVDASLKHERDLKWEASDLTDVLNEMEGSNRVNLLFLDACRDNPLSQSLARSMGESRSSAIGRGLAPMKANAGTLISYSTKEGEVAVDGKGKHSPYTEALLKHIETPGVEIGLLLRKVREEVIAATKNKQVPWEYGSLLGEFYFTGPVTTQVQPEKSPHSSASKMEARYWESIMNDKNPAVFDAYLKRYPNSEFSDLARIRIADLTKKTVKSDIPPVIETPTNSSQAQVIPIQKPVEQPPKPDAEKLPLGSETTKYTKLGRNGEELPFSATSWIMVRDNETGLIWEIKQNKDGVKNYDDPNDVDNSYKWDDVNQKSINPLNSKRFGGHSDWRLPTIEELKTLVNPNRKEPSIDTEYFSDAPSSWYWSSTVYDNYTNHAWLVFFYGGHDYGSRKDYCFLARAVYRAK